MKLTCYPYQLHFKYPFKIAHGLRETTDVVYVKLEHEGLTAWGEATLPPYLPETQHSVISFLTQLDLSALDVAFDPAAIFDSLDKKYAGNMGAKAALDMALWQLKSKMEGRAIGEMLNIQNKEMPYCTYTIGVCSAGEMEERIAFGLQSGFEIFKLKLNGQSDEEMVASYKSLCNKPFAVDVNQGWKDAREAISKTEWLASEGCLLVEQPLNKTAYQEMKLVKQSAALPVFADESCQRLNELEKVAEGFNGVNIKLMKCGGLTEAYRMIVKARELGLKVLIGCMSESSVGCSAAANLAPLADYTDLDGPWLIDNDAFNGITLGEGKITLQPVISRHWFS